MTVHQVFVHGELSRRGTLLQVLGREPLAVKATLRGYERVLDEEIDNFVAAKKDGGMIEGRLLTGITDREMLALDEFEGVVAKLYEKTMVEVEVGNGKTLAYFYVKQP